MTTAKTVQVTFDCADPRALSLFWNATLGYEFPAPPPGFDSWDAFSETLPEEKRNMASASQDPAGVGPRLFFQQVPEDKIVKNRVHLDVRAAPGLEGDDRMAALEAECERLVALGATRLERSEPAPPMSGGFIVMQDPEGNEFCLD
ncbi:glyoxalase [Nocardioides sp. Root1257]|uniref:VOC family protein n=1 Tax=unclassified Nocardioides TaxID=2615069 RepID=UPI0006F509C3|nr:MULTISPECIES: VOC family protein [unclassified Nocardioides]KQW53111.1 glyoxalase [Nocardioides sp. Root1257]KRC55799.1 glyoxalase [Nocardioides sp. Root224]